MPRVIKHSHSLVCSRAVGKHGPYTFCTGTRAIRRKDHRTGLVKQRKTKKKVKFVTPVSRSPSPKPKTPSPSRRMTLRNRPRVDYAKLHKYGK